MNLSLLAMLAVALCLVMALAWLIQRRTGASGWIDTIWSFAVGLGGMAAALAADGAFERRAIAFAIVAAWSLRLGLHIGIRTKGKGEDPRYAKLVEEWGDAAGSRLFWFLQIQAAAAFVLVLAVYLGASNQAPFPVPSDWLAILVAVVAIGGEALADWQLARFRGRPEARTSVMESGLWRYSRHPNYFFEWLGWCAWPILAIDVTNPASPAWLALLAPALMYWLLVHASGIPPLEEHMLRSRGDQFRALQVRVNAFFPGPRRNSRHKETAA